MALFKVFINGEAELIEARGRKQAIKQTARRFRTLKNWVMHENPYGYPKVFTITRVAGTELTSGYIKYIGPKWGNIAEPKEDKRERGQ